MPIGLPREPMKGPISPKLSNSRQSFIDARFKTAEEAAAHAAALFNPLSIQDDKEFGGFILKDRDGYYFNYAIGEKGAGRVAFNKNRPLGHQHVGIWHSHGGPGHAREFFSEGDHEVATRLNLPSYMVDDKGNLRKLDPKTAKTERYVVDAQKAEPEAGHRQGSTLEATVAPGMYVLDKHGAPMLVRTEVGDDLFQQREAEKKSRQMAPPQRAVVKKIGEQ